MDSHVPQNYHALPGSERTTAPGARRISHADPDELVRLLIRVRRPHGAAPAPNHSHWERTKPGHRKFLSRKELGEKYGAAQADLEHVASFARSKELEVVELHAARRLVIVTGTVRQVNHAFAVNLGKYETDDEVQRHYRGREGPIYIPKDVHHLIEGVFGLDNRRTAHRHPTQLAGGSGANVGPNGNALTPVDIANMYNFPPTPANISDQTIGILEFGGGLIISPATGQATDVDTFIGNVNASYNPPLNLSLINVTPIVLPGGANKLAGSAASQSNADKEVALDIEVAGSVANGSPIACYFAPFSVSGWLESILAAVLPDKGQPEPSVISNSWFSNEDGWTASGLQTVSSIFQQAAEAGITIFSASGDFGTDGFFSTNTLGGAIGPGGDGKAHVLYPTTDPWVTACGGTQTSNITWTNSTTATFKENTWNQGTTAGGTTGGLTGGGISTSKDSSGNLIFPIPSWQLGFSVPPSISDGKTQGRGIPDIAGSAQGYNTTVYGVTVGQGGTSEVAPLYAALVARINATLGFNVGYLNPTLYSNSASLFRKIADGASNAFTFQVNQTGVTVPPLLQTTPGYISAAPWNCLTGLGVLDGTKLIEVITGNTISPSFYFSVSKNTFGALEVSQTLSWPDAFSLILDGFSLAQVSQNPTFSGSFLSSIPGLTIQPSSNPVWPTQELGGSNNSLQRITFSYDIIFPNNPSTFFPSTGNTSILSLTALIKTSVAGVGNLPATAQFELVAGADPFFLNVSQQFQNPFWLSQDLRVLTVVPEIDSTPVSSNGNGPTWQIQSSNLYDTAAAYKYVQKLIQYLNSNFSDPTQADPFITLLPLSGGLTGDSSVLPYTIDPNTSQHHSNYNFAVARVRLLGGVGAGASVSTFFRLFLTASNDTDFQPSSTYATGPLNGVTATPKITNEDDPLTIPFFATGNYEANADFAAETDYTASGPNNRLVQITSNTGVWAYFGCYLNFYNTGNTIGPNPVASLLTGTHHCLVAEINYSGTPIATGTSTQNSSQLAQRNLQITVSDNPGPPNAHRVPQTFDMRPSAPFNLNLASNLLNWPDEIVIDWGNVPEGSTATVYWPQVQATDVIALASRLYTTHELTAADANTLSVRNVGQGKQSYIPVPSSVLPQNFAGLFTIDLPQSVVAGQEFTAVVKRLTTKQAAVIAPPPPAPQIAFAGVHNSSAGISNWRYMTGSFAVTIPVAKAAQILPPERDVLAIFKWRLSLMKPTNRWYPVLQRYISYISGRVSGLGGNPITVLPSPYGAPPIGPVVPIGGGGGGHHGPHPPQPHPHPHPHPHPPGSQHHNHEEHTGKVEGLIYDRFGDFEGFVLSTEHGQERRFRSHAAKIEELVRLAWREQMLVTVLGERGDPVKLAEIVLCKWPRI